MGDSTTLLKRYSIKKYAVKNQKQTIIKVIKKTIPLIIIKENNNIEEIYVNGTKSLTYKQVIYINKLFAKKLEKINKR